jgi:hypothetical protein
MPATAAAAKLLGPKIIKADSALTAFVPSAVRLKRSGGAAGGPAAKKNAFATATKETVVASTTNSVDDVYMDFLSEINQISGGYN